MTDRFEFEEEGRTYTCCLEQAHVTQTEKWWYFAVTGDRTRYAFFQGASNDTRASVQSRILQSYAALLERRANVVPYRPFSTRRAEGAKAKS